MDLKTQALERVVAAISPTLETELSRVAQETREALEQEFQTRLDVAVREAESATVSAAQIQLDQAVEEAKRNTRREVAAELEQQFNQGLDERLEATSTRLRNEAAEDRTRLESMITQLKDEWSAERSKLQNELDRWRTFAETQRELVEASSQPEILSRFMKSAQTFAGGLALYITKPDGLALWKSRGNGAFPEIISRETTDPESYFRLIQVRGKTVGAICATPSFQADALEFLAASLERAIEAYGLRLRAPAIKAS